MSPIQLQMLPQIPLRTLPQILPQIPLPNLIQTQILLSSIHPPKTPLQPRKIAYAVESAVSPTFEPPFEPPVAQVHEMGRRQYAAKVVSLAVVLVASSAGEELVDLSAGEELAVEVVSEFVRLAEMVRESCHLPAYHSLCPEAAAEVCPY